MPSKDIIPVINSTTSPQVCCKIDDSNTYKHAVSRNNQWVNPSSADWNVIPIRFSDARSLYCRKLLIKGYIYVNCIL